VQRFPRYCFCDLCGHWSQARPLYGHRLISGTNPVDGDVVIGKEMGKKYRSKGVKREHSIISGLLPVLERIAAHPQVDAVIPGRIKVTRSIASNVRLRIQTRTVSGLKLGARSGRASQEVFLVTSYPDAVAEYLLNEVAEVES